MSRASKSSLARAGFLARFTTLRALEPVKRPDRGEILLFLRLGAGIFALFVLLYASINYFTAGREGLWRVYWDWELSIPFWPGMILVYWSLGPLFLMPLFALDRSGLRRLAGALVWATVLAGLCWLLFPARLGFERVTEVGVLPGAYALLYAVDLPHNLLPSLHVAYSAVLLAFLWCHAPRWRVVWGGWFLLMCLSVLTVHQHHLADVVGGMGLAGLCLRLMGFGRAQATLA